MLRKQLEIKSEKLATLSGELIRCRTQRDRLKSMAEQMQEKYLHPTIDTKDSKGCSDSDEHFETLDLLTETRVQNKCLRLQVVCRAEAEIGTSSKRCSSTTAAA